MDPETRGPKAATPQAEIQQSQGVQTQPSSHREVRVAGAESTHLSWILLTRAAGISTPGSDPFLAGLFSHTGHRLDCGTRLLLELKDPCIWIALLETIT
ncbi:hypothetical protein AMECASPLE_031559 [Ameca splendens]|uniref:Uncharacterized protein n=1 Tax=Ameca splendens TaxID=208324 RepID=A0ABV1ADT6_9TELE